MVRREEDEMQNGEARPTGAAIAIGLGDEDEIIRRARALLDSKGSGTIKVWLRREDGVNPRPLVVKNLDDLAELPSLIAAAGYGGGPMEYRVRIGGNFVTGAWEPIKVAALPIPWAGPTDGGATPAVRAIAPTATSADVAPPADRAAIRAELVKEIQEDADRERREADKIAQAVAAAIAPFRETLNALSIRLAQPAAPPPAPSPVDPSAIVDKVFEKVTQVTKLGQSQSSPEITKLTKENEDLRAEQLAQEKRERRRFEKFLLRALSRKKEPNPSEQIELATARLMKLRELQVTAKALSPDDDPIDLDFKSVLRDLVSGLLPDKKTLKKLGQKVAGRVVEAVDAKPSKVPASWPAWVHAVFNDGSKVADVEWVRESLERYPEQIDGLCRISTKAGLVEFTRSTLGAAVAKKVESLPDEQVESFFTVIETLRSTVEAARAAAAEEASTEGESSDGTGDEVPDGGEEGETS